MTLPDIPRLYTALAEWLACTMYLLALPRRLPRAGTAAGAAGWLAAMAAFLQLTGGVPLAFWIPCMLAAIAGMYLYLYSLCRLTALEAGYCCARAFLLAEFAASLEWQLHCLLWPQAGGGAPQALALLGAVYAAVFGGIFWRDVRRLGRTPALGINAPAMVSAALMALAAFAVSNLPFTVPNAGTMNVFYTRTLVDLAGVLLLSMQQDQLREASLHRELDAMNAVLRRQYEQYQQSKESIRLINRHCHDLKLQIAAIRAEHDPGKRAAALAQMESGIQMYEAQNKTGNAVLDTLLTAKQIFCQQHGINFTCVADGRLLDFMSTGDICTLVGTALDNATESVQTLAEEDKRLIRAAIYAQHGFVMLRFENYCETPVPLNADGLPAQGYGVRAVRAAAEKYGGTVTVHSEDNWFTLRALLPRPQGQT